MANRYPNEQAEHDRVIDFAQSHLDKVNHDVYTNPGSYKNTSVNGLNPDIIITAKGDSAVKFIIEVETADSINQNEVQQWIDYINLGGSFYLLVPQDFKLKVELLCRQNNLKARFGTYAKDALGNITNISYE